MTVNYFIKCPTCNTITRMRTPAGYIYKTPVRIHCGKCNTLLTGEFVSDNEKEKAYYTPNNCEEVKPQAFDYFGEASGEMICNKIEPIHAEGDDIFLPPMDKVSPIFDFMQSTTDVDRTRFINYACYLQKLSTTWDKERIKYDLYLSEKNDLLLSKYSEAAKNIDCEMGTDLDAYQYVYRSLFYDLGGVFQKNKLLKLFREVNHHMSHMNLHALYDYLSELNRTDSLKKIETKLFSIAYDFHSVSNYLIPAIGLLYYNADTIDKTIFGISTCSFDDLKEFYQNTYERLLDCCEIIVGLDNIENRGDYCTFTSKLTMHNFRTQRKGNRINYLHSSEFFVKAFDLPINSGSLRNAIGHSDYKYDGIKQIISYPQKDGSDIMLNSYLVDVALECSKMLRSTLLLIFVTYELIRYNHRTDNSTMPMHSIIYKNVRSQSLCPCGSRRKYIHCCKSIIHVDKKSNTNFDYPMEADFCMSDNFKRMKP